MKFRIVTHNVLRFKGLPELAGRSDVPGTLARLYLALGPQVVCLQEVESPRDAGLLAELLGMEVRHEPGRISPKYGGAVLVDPELAFAYEPIKDSFERVCQIVEVRLGGGPVAICNLHLPSGVGHPEDGGEGVRMREIEEVISLAPDVIVGDLNSGPGSPVYRKLSEAGYIDAAAEAGMEDVPTCGRARIDYIWFRRLKLEDYEVVYRAGGVDGDVVRSLSDHLPVSALFDVDER